MRCIKAFVLLLLLPALAGAEGVLTPAANPPEPVVVLSASGIPFIKASSGTMGNNCAISAMTALPRTFSGGAYIYLPAGAIASGVPASADWYWFVGSSTTAGTCYNQTYSSNKSSNGTPLRPPTNTAFATTGPGAFTGVTTEATAVSVTIPANTIGLNGRIESEATHSYVNNANAKAATTRLGATTCYSYSQASMASSWASCIIANRSSASIQSLHIRQLKGDGTLSSSQSTVDGAVDTSASTTFSYALTTSGAATDHAILESYRIILYRRD